LKKRGSSYEVCLQFTFPFAVFVRSLMMRQDGNMCM